MFISNIAGDFTYSVGTNYMIIRIIRDITLLYCMRMNVLTMEYVTWLNSGKASGSSAVTFKTKLPTTAAWNKRTSTWVAARHHMMQQIYVTYLCCFTVSIMSKDQEKKKTFVGTFTYQMQSMNVGKHIFSYFWCLNASILGICELHCKPHLKQSKQA